MLIGLFVLARFSGNWIETEWFYYRTRYDALDPNNLRAIVIRMSLLITGLVGAIAFFAVAPRKKTWYSTLGSATLVVYLSHGFVVLSAEFRAFPPGPRTTCPSPGCWRPWPRSCWRSSWT